MNTTVYLKIKLKSLAAESKMIRFQELKTNARIPEFAQLRDQLALHRRKDVRSESRAAGIAYGFLRGTPYRSIEPTNRQEPTYEQARQAALKRAYQLVVKYGQPGVSSGFQKWTEEPAVLPAAIATKELAVL